MRREDLVFLTQTDTTIGFLSQDADKLSLIKQRPPCKHYIKALPSLKQLKAFVRVPEKHKNRLRRSKRTTFIFPDGNSYRIIKKKHHLSLIQKLGWSYTTSANLSGKSFDLKFAADSADVIVGYPGSAEEKNASTILKLNNIRIKRIR